MHIANGHGSYNFDVHSFVKVRDFKQGAAIVIPAAIRAASATLCSAGLFVCLPTTCLNSIGLCVEYVCRYRMPVCGVVVQMPLSAKLYHQDGQAKE